MTIERVARIDDPQLDDYRNVSDAELLRRRSLFVAEGRLVVRRLLASKHQVVSLLVNERSLASLADLLEGHTGMFPVYVCPTGELAEIVGFNLHRGCLALARRPEERRSSDVIANASRLLVLESVTDPDNVGSAFRNAAAFGVDGVVLQASCDPLYRKSVRTSMAAVLDVPYGRAAHWPAEVDAMKTCGLTVVALTPRTDAVDISAFAQTRPQRFALMVGSEGDGLSLEACARADVLLRIPMHEGVDSLNLATATGIALHRLTA